MHNLLLILIKSYEPEFEFQIEDASITYDLELTVRHSSQYPYQNLFLTYFIESNSGEVLNEQLYELGLFESKTGEPLGGGLGDIFDFVSVVESGYTFPKAGSYKVKLEQFMRTDELSDVVAVGLRVSPTAD